MTDTGERHPGAGPTSRITAQPVQLGTLSGRFLLCVLGFCVAAEIVFLLLDFLVTYLRWIDIGAIRRLTSITRHGGLAYWFGNTQTLMISLTLGLLYVSTERPRQRFVGLPGWLVLAVLFTLKLVHDGAAMSYRAKVVAERIHERDPDLGPLLSWLAAPLDALSVRTWHVVTLPLVLAVAGYAVIFLRRSLTPGPEKKLVLAAASCFALGAMLGGAGEFDSDDRWIHLAGSSGAFLKLLAESLFWFVLLKVLVRKTNELRLRPPSNWVFYMVVSCFAAEILFLILDYQVNYGRGSAIGAVRGLFNIAREDGLASWFGTTQTSLVALTLWLTGFATRSRSGSRWTPRGWLVLAAFFSYMSIDDGAQIHERLGTAFGKIVRDGPEGEPASWGERLLEFFPSYAWQVVVLPLFAAVGLFLLVFLWRELGQTRPRLLMIAALSCFVLAVGLDFVEGLDADHRWNLYTRITERFDLHEFTRFRFRRTPFDTLTHFSKAIEEFLEMLGNTVLWAALLQHGLRSFPDLRVSFRD